MQRSVKYYDSFMYAGESDALKIRLHELDDLVEKFIIVESTETFRGDEKPLFLNDMWHELTPWHDRIHRVILNPQEDATDPWVREKYQRDIQRHGVVNAGAQKDDIIIASDADEIPRASTVKRINPWGGYVHLDMNTYYFKLDYKVPDKWNQGGRPFVSTLAQLGSVHDTRNNQKKIAVDGAWHFSYLGDAQTVSRKIQSFAHAEYDTPEYRDTIHLQHCARIGRDPFDRFNLEPVDIDETYPQYIQDNIDQLRHLTRKG